MSISSATRKAGPYDGNGVTVAFPFAFKVFSGADVLVVSTDAGGAETPMVLTTDYTVSLNADQDASPGGTVTAVVAPATGYMVTITSNMANLQPTVVTNNGGFFPRVINDSLDRCVIQIQQLAERVGRSLQSPISSGLTVAEWFAQQVASAGGIVLPLGANDLSASAISDKTHAATSKPTPVDADEIPLADSAASFALKKLTLANLKAGIWSALGGLIGTGTGKATPVDADYLPLMDSAASNATKSLSWANIKATLKTYFDTLYASISASSSVAVRQTVLSGPVDSSGNADFVGATGSTTVTATGTLKATAAAGGDANRTGSITNPSWTGLSTNGTMFLYLDIDAAGVVTTGSTTLAPVYQWGGTYSTTNGQNTFNIQEMTMKAGNGSSAGQVYRVFSGEVTVAGGVVTAISWYAIMGRALITQASLSTSTAYTLNHNIGSNLLEIEQWLECTTTDNGYAVGDRLFVTSATRSADTPTAGGQVSLNYKTANLSIGSSLGASLAKSSPGSGVLLTIANWKFGALIRRSF